MDTKEIWDWVTIIGAVIAAITGVWNLLLQMRGKRDCFVVGLGSVSPTIGQETMMHVISHSDHPIKIKDSGFIDEDGKLESTYMLWQVDQLQSEEITSHGSTDLASRGAVFEQGYIRKKQPLGAFAISVMQKRPRICFYTDVSYWRRLRIRLRLLRIGSDYLA